MALAETRLSATEDVSSDTWVALSMRTWRRSFLLDFRAHCPWHALPLTDQASLFVLPTVQLHGEGAAVSDDYLVPLHEYIDSIPSLPPPEESEQRARAPSGTDKGELLRKCPWLEQRLRSSPGPGAAAAPRAPGAKAPPKVGYDYTDAEVEEIFNLLHQAEGMRGGCRRLRGRRLRCDGARRAVVSGAQGPPFRRRARVRPIGGRQAVLRPVQLEEVVQVGHRRARRGRRAHALLRMVPQNAMAPQLLQGI